uniref:uncharacterized protein LOC125416484 n=1 Tax=Myodes glareolus TaxID=447135 RepID=UPI0020205E36|nr:uncharacterized protein LOC125416484 [Myodes glareolus]
MGQSPPAPHEALRAGEEGPARLPPPFLPPQPPPTALRLAQSLSDVTRDGGFAPNKRDADLPPALSPACGSLWLVTLKFSVSRSCGVFRNFLNFYRTERQSSSLQLFWSVRNRDVWLPPVEFLWSGTAGCLPLSSPLSTRLVRRMTSIWLRLLRPSQYLKVRPLCRSQSNFKRENMMSISYDCFSLGYFEDVFLVLKDSSCLSSRKEVFK